MKTKYLIILLLLFPVFCFSQTIVSTNPENKNAIVEESTGIHCSYCPDGHSILNELIDQNPNDIFVIKYHEGGYAWDCDPSGGHDFANNFGVELAELGGDSGQPVASINRVVFSGSSTAISRGQWTSAISQTLQQSSYVNVGVEANIVGNELSIHVEAYYTGNSPVDSNRLIIALTQDETLGPQMGAIDFNPEYVVSNAPIPEYQHGEYEYRHMDRLVHMINGIYGEAISTTTQGSFIDRCYTYTIPSFYNDVPVDLDELEVVAYISESNQNIISGAKAQALVSNTAACTTNENEIMINSIDEPQGIVVPNEDGQNIVTVSITNSGVSPQSNIEMSYNLNDGENVNETYNGSINPNETIQYTFVQTVNLLNIEGTFEITASITSEADTDLTNNSSTNIVEIYSYCTPSLDCSYADGFQLVQIGDINNVSECEGYGDFMDQSTDLETGSTNDFTVTTGYVDQVVRVWIDFNDDDYYDLDEIVVDQWIIDASSSNGDGFYTATTDLIIPSDANLGFHKMRAKSAWQEYIPDDACELTNYGETEDYLVNIVESLSNNSIELSNKLNLFPNPSNGIFNIKSEIDNGYYILNNMIGQKIQNGKINIGNNSIDLSNRVNGVYFLTIESTNGEIIRYKLIKN